MNEWMIISNALDPVSMNKLERIYHLQLALLNSQFTHYSLPQTFHFCLMKRFMGIFSKLMLITCPLAYGPKITGFRLDFSIDFILTIINEKKRNKMLLWTDTQHLMEMAINWNDECCVCICSAIVWQNKTKISCVNLLWFYVI